MSVLPESGRAYLGAGFGLRAPYLAALSERPELAPAVVELTPSHVFGRSERLDPLIGRCAFVLHDVLASPATLAPLDRDHVERVASVARRVGALEYSDHLAMTRSPSGIELGHLVPAPLCPELLDHLCARVDALRRALELPIALELPTTSLPLPPLPHALSEGAFMSALVARSGCGLHLDLDNLRIDALNEVGPHERHTRLDEPDRAQRDAIAASLAAAQLPAPLAARLAARLAALPLAAVTRVHLAGGHVDGAGWAVDSHSTPVHPHDLALIDALRPWITPRALIIERDARLPPLAELLEEVRHVDARWNQVH